MVDMNRIRSMLAEKRRELADQLDAIDRAIAALNGAGTSVAETRPAKGLVREMPDDSFVPAIRTRGESQAPRLVKRPIQK